MNRFLSPDLIDTVFESGDYRTDLEAQTPGADEAADFIARSLGWWRGLENRRPGTRGLYLLSLASREGRDHAEEILEILESLTLPDWHVAKSCARDLDRIRGGLAAGDHLDSAPFARRLAQVQTTLGEDLGVRTSGQS